MWPMAMWAGLKEGEIEKTIKVSWQLTEEGKDTLELEMKQSQLKQLWER